MGRRYRSPGPTPADHPVPQRSRLRRAETRWTRRGTAPRGARGFAKVPGGWGT